MIDDFVLIRSEPDRVIRSRPYTPGSFVADQYPFSAKTTIDILLCFAARSMLQRFDDDGSDGTFSEFEHFEAAWSFKTTLEEVIRVEGRSSQLL